ncbi:Lhr family helicase [Geomesophilobacter sediminis]|uniref:DEAD/DEAH box helicase n=1 Tax=Geomesophilobacter sediminis TaxID=2798584 RepID=A0A8J7LY03_9BACT|nr:DEAD/DEAH box helicase [Geomesophilobacter sediminis]MBJ6724021.1 DEAD/DEAH box helicase [Geomesophilobacter sediminis]
MAMHLFSPATGRWFEDAFGTPTEIQRRGWDAIAAGHHALLIAPTGSGKTLAAFLWGIDHLSQLPPGTVPGVRLLYVSPLKSLIYDVERNLRAPLAGVTATAAAMEAPWRDLRVDVRTGDTPARDRRLQARRPADLLVTTPESLFLLLGSAARETLASVETVIIDEIHALAPTKRGTHLALSLERLAELTGRDPQRVGLSATVRPAAEVARFLGGEREVDIVDASVPPLLDLEVTVPIPDMEFPPVVLPSRHPEDAEEGPLRPTERGIWPTLYPVLLDEIRNHRSTILFVNSRGLCERLARRMNELAGEELVLAHHGSVAREKRLAIEQSLKEGTLKGIVATSSLELGIDMGAVDLVLLVESPGSVARGLQRVGRSGHQVGAVSVGRIYPKFRGDLVECAVVAASMLKGEIEPLKVPHLPLDVLAQQIAAICADRPRTVEEVAALVRRAYPYRDLSREALTAVLDMLSGRYPSTDFADLHPLISWDRAEDLLTARRGTGMLVLMNGGTIPDRGSYGVFLGPEGPRIGELDEEMVYESRAGENILLGASTWHIEEITRDRVIVSPAAPGEPGKLPFWHGDGPGRPIELGRALGAFLRDLGSQPEDEAVAWLREHYPLSHLAAQNIAAYVFDQRRATGTLPTDRSITIERFRDELGDWRVAVLSPFGARIHAPWAMAIQHQLAVRSGFEMEVMYTDDGMVLRFADVEEIPPAAALLPDPDEVEQLVTEQLLETPLFAGLFRENAGRALLIPRRRPDRRTPLWAQRLKAQHLLAAVKRYPSFPVVLETFRQAMADVFDLPGLKVLLRGIRSREITVVESEGPIPSPFARSLVFAYVARYLYEQDAPPAERKAQALTLDRTLLKELLGQGELRELIDPRALAELEEELQHRAAGRQARDADTLHDLLRRLGDLSRVELAPRCEAAPGPWLERLQAERRALWVCVAGEERCIAAEDAALYRDGLGIALPAGLPPALLSPVERPLENLLQRYARSHGPFPVRDPAARFGISLEAATAVLIELEAEGKLTRGEIRPDGFGTEWCDVEVLRSLKRRTLEKLRHEAAPVAAPAFARFLASWQGLTAKSGVGLEDAIAHLEGVPLPWSMLESVLIPARVRGVRRDELDLLAATGSIVWVGRGPLGHNDGRVALYRRENAALIPAPAVISSAPLSRAIVDHLEQRGASFLTELEKGARTAVPKATLPEFTAALWDLVWAGAITNDTFAPLRSLAGGDRQPRGRHLLAGGRWSLVRHLALETNPTELALKTATMLLERYGIVSREVAQAEEIPGGFGPVYQALKALEDAGRVRRGYFVEGFSGAQFALPGAVDRLRASRNAGPEAPYHDDDCTVLATVDPANPYGAMLPWPPVASGEGGQPRRVPDAWVVIVAGVPGVVVGSGGRSLICFADAEGEEDFLLAALGGLHRIPRSGRRHFQVIEKVNGVPVHDSPYLRLLLRAGFERDYRGVTPVQEAEYR